MYVSMKSHCFSNLFLLPKAVVMQVLQSKKTEEASCSADTDAILYAQALSALSGRNLFASFQLPAPDPVLDCHYARRKPTPLQLQYIYILPQCLSQPH
jgi:hypothetical protein